MTVDTLQINIRLAVEADRERLAELLAEAYRDDFAVITSDASKVAACMADGMAINRFYVVETDSEIAAVAALTDITGRAMYFESKVLRKNLGFFRGWLLRMFTKKEMEGKLVENEREALIEFVAVDERFRGNRLSGKLVEYMLDATDYATYILDVKDNNTPAVITYQRAGFTEYKREKMPKGSGFEYKVFMRYAKKKELN